MTTDKKEHLYKILVIGELGTGKTSLIKRYVHNLYSPNYRATVNFNFFKYSLKNKINLFFCVFYGKICD